MQRAASRSLDAATVVALGLAAVVAYAAFADGAIALPMEARLQAGIAALALLAIAALLFGRGVRVSAATTGWAGIVALLAFAIYSGL
jgi:hypothetical protein